MSGSKLDARQTKLIAPQAMIGSGANDTLDTVFPRVNDELAKLFEDRNILLVGGGNIAVNAGATSVTFSAALVLSVNSLVAGGAPKMISLGSTTRTFGSDGDMMYAVIDRVTGVAIVTDDAATLSAVTSADQEVVLIAKRVGTTIYFRDGTAIPAGRTVTLGASDLYGSLGGTTNQLVKTSGTDGKTLQGTGITVDSSNNVTGIASETVQTSIVTQVSAESITTDSTTTGSNATIASTLTPIIKLTNSSLVSIDGVHAGITGQSFTIINDTSTTILVNNDTGGIVANRIYTGTKKPLSLKDQASIIIKYEPTSARWRVIGGTGAGTGTGGAGGGELADLMYSCAVRDSFTDILGATPTDISAGQTDSALFDIANELFKLNYDASKTTHASTPCTTTSITMASAPAFTVKIGDVVVFNGEARKITTVTSQVIYTVEAFTTAPGLAAAVNISQVVHTVDLNNFNAGGTGLSAASQYSGNIDEIMLGYWDSATALDVIPDYGSPALIAFTASTDTTSWTTVRTRTDSLSSSEVPVTCPTSNPNLYLRFFANKTSGSGTVNLLSYKVFFQKIFGQTAGGTYYTAFARPTSNIAQNCSIGLVGGKTRFTFTFPYTRGLNAGEASGSILEVSANGQLIPRYTAGITDNTQTYFTEINDNTIEMDTDYSTSGIDFQFKVQRVGIIDTNTNNTTKIALHDDLLDAHIDAQVIPTFLTAINGSPSVGQFRSDITGRASIPDLSTMLSVQMGPQRMMTQEIYQLQNEFGPVGQPVYGTVNDKFNQIRMVGNFYSNTDNTGQRVYSTPNATTDYVEIIFYGTGLNILALLNTSGFNWVVSVDGGSDSSNIVPAAYSNITLARNYSENKIINAVSGLSLGLHTVKIRNNTVSQPLTFYGFEVLTETTSLRVTPGNIVKGKYKNALSSLQTITYDSNFESGSLSTKGGCVLVYLKTDGTVGKAVTPTDSSIGYLTGASHTNEEVVRVYNWREFGAGRSDDFSLLTASSRAAAFTLDDGTTTLVASSVFQVTSTFTTDCFAHAAANDFIIFTFVGTGLDIFNARTGASAAQYSIFIDGVSQGTSISFPANSTYKICSGLPYGTHTVKILATSVAGAGIGFSQFTVYAPKKPSLPTGAIELAQYYKNADYVAATSIVTSAVGSGVIRKMGIREVTYVGTWPTPNIDIATMESGWDIDTNTATSYFQYTFFGTGIIWNGYINGAVNATILVDGVALNTGSNIGSTVGVIQAGGLTLSAAGVMGGTTSGKFRISISGLSLGKHTITITQNTTVFLYADCFDIITPIHATTINGPYVLQNTLALGNNNFLDLRKFNKKDISQAAYNKVSQAVAVGSATTSSTSDIPLTDMSISHNSITGRIKVSYSAVIANNSAGQVNYISMYVDGVSKRLKDNNQPNTNYDSTVSDFFVVNVSPGFHKIDLYFRVGAGTINCGNRNITVEDI